MLNSDEAGLFVLEDLILNIDVNVTEIEPYEAKLWSTLMKLWVFVLEDLF